MILILVTISFFTLIFAVYIWIKKRYSLWRDMGALYEPPTFPYGSLKGIKAHDHEGTTMEKYYWKYKGKGPFVGLYFALEPVALILDIDLVKKVFISDFSSFQDRGFFINAKHEPISAHLGAGKQPHAKIIRTKLAPAFTMAKMKGMFPLLEDLAGRFGGKISEACARGEELDAKDICAGFTMDCIWNCVFGIDSKCLENRENDFFRFGSEIFSNPRHSTLVLFIHIALRKYAETLRLKVFRDEVSKYFTELVKEILELRLNKNERRVDMMDTLTEAYKHGELTFNDVLAQSFGFLIAGYETSAATIHFCLFELARNPTIQEKTRNYIQKMLEKHNHQLTFEAMMEMKYIDQLIYETMRLRTPVSNLTREAMQDYTVPNTNFTFKKGTLVFIPVHAIHRDPEFYPDFEVFDPDRFSEENIRRRPPATFLSFGDGPRNCMGMKLGVLQTKIGIISALRGHRYSISSKVKLPIELQTKSFVTCPAEKIWLKVETVV